MDSDGAPQQERDSGEGRLLEIQDRYATRAEDARRWLVASVLSLAAGSLALHVATTGVGRTWDASGLVSATLLAMSLILGITGVMFQFLGAGRRTNQLGHAAQAAALAPIYEVNLQKNNRARTPEARAETNAVAQGLAKEIEKERLAATRASTWARWWEGRATPFVVLQTLTWLIGFAILVWMLWSGEISASGNATQG